MKTPQQHELETVSGGQWVWRPCYPQAPAHLRSPRDGEWLDLLEVVPELATKVPPSKPDQICPIVDVDAYPSF